MDLHPLIIVDIKSIRNIRNGFTPFDYCGCQVYYETSGMDLHPLIIVDVKS